MSLLAPAQVSLSEPWSGCHIDPDRSPLSCLICSSVLHLPRVQPAQGLSGKGSVLQVSHLFQGHEKTLAAPTLLSRLWPLLCGHTQEVTLTPHTLTGGEHCKCAPSRTSDGRGGADLLSFQMPHHPGALFLPLSPQAPFRKSQEAGVLQSSP